MMRQMLSVFLLFLGSMVSVSADGQEPQSPDRPGNAAVADPSDDLDAKEDPKSHPVSFWMEKKLEYSQEILRGLATGDLEVVAQKAEQMRVLSRIEGWVRNGKPGYRAQFQAFQFANAEILRNARADNLDGATLGFQQLTISCVSCHKILRDVD
jgi:hypothetical protein